MAHPPAKRPPAKRARRRRTSPPLRDPISRKGQPAHARPLASFRHPDRAHTARPRPPHASPPPAKRTPGAKLPIAFPRPPVPSPFEPPAPLPVRAGDPTAAEAARFVKMLNAGVPGADALRFVRPLLPECDLPDTLAQWSTSPVLAHANTLALAGAWEDLSAEKRMEIAIAKHLQELAYYLYTHRFETADTATLKRMEEARRALTEANRQGDGSTDSPWVQWTKHLIGGDTDDGRAELDGPPRLTHLPDPEGDPDDADAEADA